MLKKANASVPQRSAAGMFPVIEKYLHSDLPQKAFCQQENLNYKTFHYWLKKYREQQKAHISKKKTGATPFLPVRITQPPAPERPSCEILFPSGITIRFNHCIDVRVLRQLISSEPA